MKLKTQFPSTRCRMCKSLIESTPQLLSGAVKLHKACTEQYDLFIITLSLSTQEMWHSAPENGTNKIDTAEQEQEHKAWILMEGTMCQVGKIKEKTSLKQEKCDSPTGRQDYKITHISNSYDQHCAGLAERISSIT